MTKLVTVLLPVYNCASYLKNALESIVSQTYKNLEIIVLDDNSTDASSDIYSSINDERIRVYKGEVNVGLANILNIGIELANGDYIARMDADDISEESRIEEQVEYLNRYEEISFVGSNAICIDESDRQMKLKSKPVTPFFLSIYARYSNPIIHPSVMIRKEVFSNINYPDWKRGQDYGLFSSLIRAGYLGANIPKPLLRYRIVNMKSKKKILGFGRFEARRLVRGKSRTLPTWEELSNNNQAGLSFLQKLEDYRCLVLQKAVLLVEKFYLKLLIDIEQLFIIYCFYLTKI